MRMLGAHRVRPHVEAGGVARGGGGGGWGWRGARGGGRGWSAAGVARMEAPLLKTSLPGPKAAALIARDKKSVSPSYTRDYPLVMAGGGGGVGGGGAGAPILARAARPPRPPHAPR